MSRKPKTEAAEELSQAGPTQPRPMDAHGFELDGWGLPLCGPRRIEVLAGRPDPADDEAAWKAATEGAPTGGAAGDDKSEEN